MKSTKKLNIVSLFDGISCGQLAMQKAGFKINRYVAFETDKYARSITRYNYPQTEHKGDANEADFNLYKGFDMVMGGSPCTFWSVAKTNREVDKSGMGWKLFMQFIKALQTINPPYYLCENVASMPASIKEYISEEFGCLPIKINSALVSAQQRNRLYWTNIGQQNEIPQPEDKQIMLKDIIESDISWVDKAYYQTATYQGASFEHTLRAKQRTMIAEPIILRDKSPCLCATYYKKNVKWLLKKKQHGAIVTHKVPDRIGQYGKGGQGDRIYSVYGKSVSMTANGGDGAKTGLYKIDLPDGDYNIRKLTPKEAERCQTIPDDYTANGIDDNGKTVPISNTQRYKTIGNGWTVDVISHILKHISDEVNKCRPH